MNGRAIVIGSGLLATVVGIAGIGVAAAADGDSADTSRPTARWTVELPAVDPALRARAEAVNIARWVKAVNEKHYYEVATLRIEAERQAAARREAANRPRSSSGSGGDVLSCIKHRESRGQYGAVNSSSGAAGAYQFMPRTWDNNAATAGRQDLVGVNPANASAADQDAMARHLMSWQGLGPWGGACG